VSTRIASKRVLPLHLLAASMISLGIGMDDDDYDDDDDDDFNVEEHTKE
jgi:hypothetical protein